MIPVSAETMRELDRMAAKSGVPALSLMENAGDAISKKAVALLRNLKGNTVAVFCGRGNNGGDGMVAARKINECGHRADAYLLGSRDKVKNEAAVNLESFTGRDGKVRELISETDIEKLKGELDYSLIIDAISGTGFSGYVSGPLKKLIELLNSSGIPILAVDVPSGLNSTTGETNPIAIKANWTISFALAKKGFYEENGPKHTGEIEVRNIGFSEGLLKKAIEFEKKL